MTRPPRFEIDGDTLPVDPKERHEALVNVFGQYLFWARHQTMQAIRSRGDSSEERSALGQQCRTDFDEIAQLRPEDRERAYAIAQRAMDIFARMMLTMISGQGFDDSLGQHHVFRYRLTMEICDSRTGDVVLEEVINRNGEKFFPEYWGRWLNRFPKCTPG